MANYTERIDGFQICDPTYLGDPPKDRPPMFSIVKWYQTEPQEVIDMRTGMLVTITEHCCVVARLEWNKRERCFDFKSVGLRWLRANPSQVVIDMILDFAKKKEAELCEDD